MGIPAQPSEKGREASIAFLQSLKAARGPESIEISNELPSAGAATRLAVASQLRRTREADQASGLDGDQKAA